MSINEGCWEISWRFIESLNVVTNRCCGVDSFDALVCPDISANSLDNHCDILHAVTEQTTGLDCDIDGHTHSIDRQSERLDKMSRLDRQSKHLDRMSKNQTNHLELNRMCRYPDTDCLDCQGAI